MTDRQVRAANKVIDYTEFGRTGKCAKKPVTKKQKEEKLEEGQIAESPFNVMADEESNFNTDVNSVLEVNCPSEHDEHDEHVEEELLNYDDDFNDNYTESVSTKQGTEVQQQD